MKVNIFLHLFEFFTEVKMILMD